VATQRLEIETRPGSVDALAVRTRERLESWLGLHPACVRTRKVYHLDLGLSDAEAAQVLECLTDPIAEVGALGMLPDAAPGEDPPWTLWVGYLPGVTDGVGQSVARAARDRLGRPLEGRAASSVLYLFRGLDRAQLELAAREVLHNPLVQRIRIERAPRELDAALPSAGSAARTRVETVPLRGADDARLLEISREGLLALSLEEMQAVRAHFVGRGRDPTDGELEVLAQTWSEHCKHKIFASPIEYTDPEGVTTLIERGLFRTHVRGATEEVARARQAAGMDPPGEPFLVSVFHDNAGVVRFTERDHLVYKVETHNSPSALDPYGGAMTGIVGVNRDSFGTGLGADLLTNVWGYCLGDPDRRGTLPPGLMHPRRIRSGVHEGVVDGGNQSGIPYSRGFERFDERYVGKPLVYCGTVAAMPVESAGRPTHEKPVAPGDRIVMVGGRIGKDGIHGATFSSVHLDESSPPQAVQIGDPLTQKMMFDLLAEARDAGLYSGITDNGAGGLSSSVGEMAQATGGARIDLEHAPLKYPGLSPWEILVSEAQERMTLAVPPSRLEAFLALAAGREVEATVLGELTDSGHFEVFFGDALLVDLPLEFLHGGVPLPRRRARWSPPAAPPPDPGALADLGRADEIGPRLLALLARPGLASHADLARRYDHEVKGLSVIKPLVGIRGDVPSTATVMRVRHGRHEGVVLAEGIHPFYGDLDTDAMARAAVDEGVRRVLCAGARLDRIAALDNFCWPDPIQSPDTPDGEHKLAQLVRCCEGLHAACVAYGVPLISGKDSMKNDARLGGIKISIPPTLLVSVIGQTEDVRRAIGLEPRRTGDLLFLLGSTRDELGGSELARQLGVRPTTVPRTDVRAGAAALRAFAAARDAGLVRSAHVCGSGGLAVALAHLVLASGRGVDADLHAVGPDLAPGVAAFSESTGRIVIGCRPEDAAPLESALARHGCARIGTVVEGGSLRLFSGARMLTELPEPRLRAAFAGDPHAG
jgi:phosphoribosylformylglycinamidine synthase